jgi:hypothetical protein
MRWRGIFTGLSLDGGQADFSKKSLIAYVDSGEITIHFLNKALL